ncbi:hypothetical protein QNH36_05515 [Mesobacillus sp. AQ2]|nr:MULTISPECIES: hypothetical protein [Bacillaceae]WHX41614.1 hypothetical protein QNH36_05515 [Mesobacillus sp. AQ2]
MVKIDGGWRQAGLVVDFLPKILGKRLDFDNFNLFAFVPVKITTGS